MTQLTELFSPIHSTLPKIYKTETYSYVLSKVIFVFPPRVSNKH